MIPPLAVTPPPEPATTPAPRGVDRFAGTLARALTNGTRRHRPAADESGDPADAAQSSPDVDADATTSPEAPGGRNEPAADGSDELAGAAAVGAAVAGIAEPAPGAGMPSGPPARVVDADAIAVDPVAIGVAAGPAPVEPLLAGDHEAAGESTAATALEVSTPVAAAPAKTGGDHAQVGLDRADAGFDAVVRLPAESDSAVAPADGTERDDPTTAAVADLAAPRPAGAAVTPLDSSPQPPLAGPDAPSAARRSPIGGFGDDTALDPATDAGPADRTGAPPRVEVASSDRDPSGAAHVMAAPIAAAPSATSTATHPSPGAGPAPGTTAIAAADAVRYLRELGPARAVQRLAVDLDGAMVAVRVDHTGAAPTVRVQVVDDPAGRLSASWATNVERTLTQTMQHDGAGAEAEQRRRDRAPANPDDARPSGASGRRWALALGGEP